MDKKIKINHGNGIVEQHYKNTEKWYKDGVLHRENAPAVIHINGAEEWYLNGKKHREDGPAIDYSSDFKQWFIFGEELTEEEFNSRKLAKELNEEMLINNIKDKKPKL